jgi:hypothetical protein
MGSEAWTIDPDPSEPDEVLMSTPCADGVESHSWRLVIDEGFATFRSGCMSCEEFIEDMYGEAYVVADIAVALTWESCGNAGGWHGMERCDCAAYWIVEPDQIPDPPGGEW